MTTHNACVPLASLQLRGSPHARGRQQAAQCPAEAPAVRAAVARRLGELAPMLRNSAVATWLAAQHAFVREHDPAAYAETQGIAEGFGIVPGDLLTCLHGNMITDMAAGPAALDGCTAWAARTGNGAIVVKNRDYRGDHAGLQRVFRHADPGWGGRRLLCVGSLGSPGAFSSGINSDGLAVVDTQVATTSHGVGWLRYFLMTRILRECASVTDAIALVVALPHAGGGTLLLGDAAGDIRAVELGHRAVALEEPGTEGFVARTNHFVSALLRDSGLAGPSNPDATTSRTRLAALEQWLRTAGTPATVEAIGALMSRHDDHGSASLCRHAADGGSRTLSCAVYDCRIPALDFCSGAPCQGDWGQVQP